jgi:N-hydroxyarylamine O-acetyltransferase
MTETFDLDAYLARTGYAGPLAPIAAVLADLHQAHATAIPFENIDVLRGRPPRLDLDSLPAKLVRDRRGGYCYEQNTLLAAVLERVGFRVTRLAARVWFRATRRLPRTHMLLRVDLPDGPVIADVGFGGAGFFHPLPLVDEVETTQFAWAYRLTREAGTWMLQSREADGWADLYEFSEEPQHQIDFEPANHFVATHPASAFTRTLAVQRITPEVRFALRNREFVTDRGTGAAETRTVPDDELIGLLDRVFGLRLPPDTRFPDHPWGAPPPDPAPR